MKVTFLPSADPQLAAAVMLVAAADEQKLDAKLECFPADTRIQTAHITSTAISGLRVGDVVLAFDARADKGRGALVPRRVMRLYRNTTTDWIRLRWVDGTAREVITTQGHHFLDEFGQFPTIEEMARTGCAKVVLASGALKQVTAERTPFRADVAPGVGRRMGRGGGLGSVAGKVGEREGWVRGPVEGEGVRGYGAGGVMGRGRRGRRGGAGSVHMWTVWKLTESQGSVNFRSSDVWGIVRGCDSGGVFGVSSKGRRPKSNDWSERDERWVPPTMRLLSIREF